MDASRLLTCRHQIESDLRENILPFWIRHVVDAARGTFHGQLGNDLRVDPTAERGALLSSRILWTYAAAYRRYADPAYHRMADFAYADLLARYHDPVHGGFIWSVSAQGQPLRTRKQIYGQAFAIYALTEYHLATARPEPLTLATETYRLIERHAMDRALGGYFEAFSQDWSPIADMRLSDVDMNEPKSQNTLLHVMEAYTNLLRAWPDSELRHRLAALVDLMLTRVLNPQTHHLGLFFSQEWEPRTDRISYGHDIEASWLLTEAAEVVAAPGLLQRCRDAAVRIAEVTLAEGVDTDGAIFNEGDPTGVTDPSREWWPQAEGVVGFLNAAQLTGQDRFLSAALQLWDYIQRHLIDHERGEWYWNLTRDGQISASKPKVGFWKCPYHNGRMGLEAVRRLEALVRAKTSPTAS
jgi:cellobiose epimerase